MIRRSLRIGIRLGMLGGLAFALFKIVQARRPLPAVPLREDPWVPSGAPAPAAETSRAPATDEPALVQPTMLHSTSLKRPGTGTGDRSFDPASTAPPVVAPDSPFAPTAATPPTVAPLITAEIEPDDDEIVILSTGNETVAPDGPVAEVSSETPIRAAASSKASAKKAAPKVAGPKKAAPKKAAARKTPAKKAAPKKAAARKTPAKKAAASSTATWVEPEGGVCPTTHPVKAKLRSAIFHLPGMAAYSRTSPDRCYRDERAATNDGLRKAAR
ncbi:MAG: hypothetical protein M3256_10055 [Actinomycetota bacterium]|nr:hypothetical protein [Actinomycetota bacterium]